MIINMILYVSLECDNVSFSALFTQINITKFCNHRIFLPSTYYKTVIFSNQNLNAIFFLPNSNKTSTWTISLSNLISDSNNLCHNTHIIFQLSPISPAVPLYPIFSTSVPFHLTHPQFPRSSQTQFFCKITVYIIKII